MSDRIKKIKVKKQDGTFSDYIPIGADAENIDTTDGESVQLKLNKKPYYYNNVAAMKTDTKLKAGDMAITLGYYTANDGGGAEYKIVNGIYIDDGGSYHQLNNNLKAELIIKKEVNVKQFGAWGDGVHDDTNYIQNAITVSKSYKTKAFAIGIPGGIYNISKTIELPLYVKLYSLGNITIKYTGSEELFHIYNDSNIVEMTSNLSQNPYNIGNILDGSKGVIILKGQGKNLNQTALRIGENSLGTIHKTHTAWANFTNIYIEQFKYGIYFTNYQNYIMRFYNITISNCDIAISNANVIGANNGELILFTGCSLNNNNLGVQVNHVINFSFNGCSIDYNINGIELNWQGYYSLNLNDCWLEGNNDDTLNTYLIKSNVPTLSGAYSSPSINIINCLIYPTNKKPHTIIFGKMKLNIENCQIQVVTINSPTDKNSEFLCDDNVEIISDKGNTFVENTMLISKNNILNKNYDFSNGENNYTFAQYGVSHSIVNDLYYAGSKLLKLEGGNPNYQRLTTDKFNVSKYTKLLGQILISVISDDTSQRINCSITIKFYDKNDNELIDKEISINDDYTYTILNQLTLVPKSITNNNQSYINIPNEAYTCEFTIIFGNLLKPLYIDNIAICGF